jgi:hypothetical protein
MAGRFCACLSAPPRERLPEDHAGTERPSKTKLDCGREPSNGRGALNAGHKDQKIAGSPPESCGNSTRSVGSPALLSEGVERESRDQIEAAAQFARRSAHAADGAESHVSPQRRCHSEPGVSCPGVSGDRVEPLLQLQRRSRLRGHPRRARCESQGQYRYRARGPSRDQGVVAPLRARRQAGGTDPSAAARRSALAALARCQRARV